MRHRRQPFSKCKVLSRRLTGMTTNGRLLRRRGELEIYSPRCHSYPCVVGRCTWSKYLTTLYLPRYLRTHRHVREYLDTHTHTVVKRDQILLTFCLPLCPRSPQPVSSPPSSHLFKLPIAAVAVAVAAPLSNDLGRQIFIPCTLLVCNVPSASVVCLITIHTDQPHSHKVQA